jgi:hypothetical protein
MACCVLIMAFIGQLFAIRRWFRRLLGLPVSDWYDDAPQPGLVAVWGLRLRRLLRSGSLRATVVTLACAELSFMAVAAPGGHGLIAEHRLHARQAWEYIQTFGAYAPVASLWCDSAEGGAKVVPK